MEDITIVDIPTLKVIGMRKQGKYDLIPQILPQVFKYAIAHGAKFTGPPLFICHEITVDEVMKADKDGTAYIEIAIPIEEFIEESQDINCYELSGGTMAKIIHKGPYQDCQTTYEKLYA